MGNALKRREGKVLEQLQPGALGTMLVAQLKTHQGAQKKYAIKQVECIDQHQANVALKEVSSLFLCLVMQHSGQGDLSALIKEKRQKSEKITDMVIQKFLGQMVGALFYIHKQNIWHRNLKPSNILVTGEPSFMLSDFSTETLMKDELKWKIRVEEESKSWMAPETFGLSFTEKSDIWSLGCVLLDMMSCFVLNAEEINSLLQNIREDSSCLEGVLTLMQDGESSYLPFFPILVMMLQIEPSMRPTARDLVTVPFVGKCLTFAGDTSIKLKKSLPPTITDELFQGGVENVLEFMQAFWDIEEVQAKGIQHLARFVDDESGHSENNADQAVLESALPVTSAVLRKHLQNGVVAESACSALWALALQGCLTDSDYEPTAALLLDALRVNPERAVLVKNGCLALASLVRLSETAALAILLDSEGSGIELIKDEYHLHSNEPGVAEALCLLMNEMVQYGEMAAAVTS
ncbi:Serine/threonine kinase-like domain-containing protein STKLD1 [Lonchura striata]|uniref:non-specific serine/threonine protein kinase n=1 Tax=Lonchura striata TaxID=40157 RepID=A0A218V5V7_9PASE|nr:Serine/threonine kinase-like domain-containing protein STKLD1 [Lonchura striata domestica]